MAPALSFSGNVSLAGYGLYHERNLNIGINENLIWIKGRHALKFGGVLTRYNKNENLNYPSQFGNFTFVGTGAPTGTSSFTQEWANFMLGNVSSFSQPSTDITPNLWEWQFEAYAQDDVKLTPHLTLSAGLRYSFYGQPTDTNGELDNFDPAAYVAANAPKIDPTTGNVVAGAGTNWQTNGIIIGGKNSPFGNHAWAIRRG